MYLYFLFELKVISSPGQFVQWPVIKIFNFLGLFSNIIENNFFFLFSKFFLKFQLIKKEILSKRLDFQ